MVVTKLASAYQPREKHVSVVTREKNKKDVTYPRFPIDCAAYFSRGGAQLLRCSRRKAHPFIAMTPVTQHIISAAMPMITVRMNIGSAATLSR